ncbi:hypothetical protein BO71DRAFT_432611 [Aspergillus ellipticus CBS 707.79]|uniref:Uncharacterized protein n=1 Tax=Aspergillus ellipticus CBS 707.79 TaxID=1448320 RepID=A0A319D3J5_9EURO|nr:hypothetical protein BO71DRAFT_432611 [Aspergillus ellipticus CBS 707.79]
MEEESANPGEAGQLARTNGEEPSHLPDTRWTAVDCGEDSNGGFDGDTQKREQKREQKRDCDLHGAHGLDSRRLGDWSDWSRDSGRGAPLNGCAPPQSHRLKALKPPPARPVRAAQSPAPNRETPSLP